MAASVMRISSVPGPLPSIKKKGALVSELTGGHHYCDYDLYYNDGEYDTITREDETDLDLNIVKDKVQIIYTSMTQCNTTDFASPGLMCGQICLQFRGWCQDNSIA